MVHHVVGINVYIQGFSALPYHVLHCELLLLRRTHLLAIRERRVCLMRPYDVNALLYATLCVIRLHACAQVACEALCPSSDAYTRHLGKTSDPPTLPYTTPTADQAVGSGP